MSGVLLTLVLTIFQLLPIGPRAEPVDAAGLHVVGVDHLNTRLLEVTASTSALSAETKFRVLLPDGYDDHPGQRYRVLYLLHGGGQDYRWWTDEGDVQDITAAVPVIVVMPDGGSGGWYSDWYNFGLGGPPEWETFHIGQLIPWVDANFRTTKTRAIAGLSMGGFGAMSYAARHPGLFVAAASFSGAVDLNSIPATLTVEASPLVALRIPTAVWGLRLLSNPRWQQHNPWNIAQSLRGMHLAVYTGNGLPGPLDGPLTLPDLTELWIHRSSVAFDEKLTALGIPHTFVDYGPGTHSAPYWQRDLRQELPAMMAVSG